jgi:phosphate transporter
MFIPLLAVPIAVLPNLTHREIGEKLLSATFDHVQILVLGGLCMSKALAKHKMEMLMAKYVLKPIAHRPRLFVLVLMIITVLACGVLSNVAAPVLVLNVVQPTLWRMKKSDGGPQAILLCLAWAGNFGGMLLPISSPQNAVALKALGPNAIQFGPWVAGTLPLALIGVLVGWFLTMQLWDPFQPRKTPDGEELYIIPVASGATGGGAGDVAAAAADKIEDGENVAADETELEDVIDEGDELAIALFRRGPSAFNP